MGDVTSRDVTCQGPCDFPRDESLANLRHVSKRQVADTPLARAVDDLVEKHGSDQKLAEAMGVGDRFTVIRWRKGTVPTEPELIEALVRLGINRKLIDDASASSSIPRPALEDQVADLRAALTDARLAHDALLERVAKLEQSGRRRASG